MTNPNLIAQEWDNFAKHIMPEDAGEVQRQEMRRAFYAGAAALLALQMEKLEPGDDPTEADMQMMENLQAEVEAFMADIAEGRA